MLSKVLSGRSADRAEPAAFLATAAPYHPPTSREPASDDEVQLLRDQVAQLRAEVAMVKKESFEAGRRQGEEDARSEITPVIQRMHASVAELTGLRSEMRRRAENDLVQLALLIARRVLHRELSVDPNALAALARVVFDRMTRAESYRITVHPVFAPAISAALPAGKAGTVRIEPDPSCAAGTLIVRSEEGLIDASVDSQLEEIGRGLTDRLARSGANQ